MYRQHLLQKQKMEEQSKVLTRVTNYPVVRDTICKVTEVYQRGKDGSRILRFCGNMAETGVNMAYVASKPVLQTIPVSTLNDYAVQRLEDLEKKYPIIVKPTEDVVTTVKNYSLDKIDQCKSYGTQQLNRLADLARLNAVLNIADATVDRFLPPVKEEGQALNEETVAVAPVEATTRLRVLSDKVKRRAYENAMARAGALQKRSQEAIGKLMYTVDLIDYARDSVGRVSMDDCKKKVLSVYEEITAENCSEETDVLPEDATLEKKAIYVARSMTCRARTTFATVSKLTFSLPVQLRARFNDATTYAESLFQTFSKASSFKDISPALLAQIRQKISFLEDFSANISAFVVQCAPLRWLAFSGKELSAGDSGQQQVASNEAGKSSLQPTQCDIEPSKSGVEPAQSVVEPVKASVDPEQNVDIDDDHEDADEESAFEDSQMRSSSDQPLNSTSFSDVE